MITLARARYLCHSDEPTATRDLIMNRVRGARAVLNAEPGRVSGNLVTSRKGSMVVADPNSFQGEILVSEGKSDWQPVAQAHRYGDGNYRILGLAEMAGAIVAGRPHRAGMELALHVLEVMEAITTSATAGQRVHMVHGCARPAMLRADADYGLPS